MARRDFGVLFEEDGPAGGEDALARGMAVGYRFGPAVIEAVFDSLAAMDRLGGQLVIQVRRSKYDAQGNEIPFGEHKSTPGEYITDGFVFAFENRDRTLQEIAPPDAVELSDVIAGVPEPVEVEDVTPVEEPEPAAA